MAQSNPAESSQIQSKKLKLLGGFINMGGGELDAQSLLDSPALHNKLFKRE
jgi:hypothetical protein